MKNIKSLILPVLLGVVVTLTIQNLFFQPEDPDTRLLEWKLKELHKKNVEQDKIIYRSGNRTIERNERLKKDSILIMHASRPYRDSLRKILNPAN